MTPLLLLLAAAPSFKTAVGFERAPAPARAALAKDGFAVLQGEEAHFFALYDRNAYEKVPSFISSDVVLHVFHTRFDEQLSDLELKQSLLALLAFSRGQLARCFTAWPKTGEPPDWLRKLCTYHAVAVALATDAPLGADARVEKDVIAIAELVKRAGGPASVSPCGQPVEFSLFKPRGHYERYALQPFFKASMWYSQCAFDLSKDLARAAEIARLIDEPAKTELAKITAVRELVSGPPDDAGFEQLRALGTMAAFPAPLDVEPLKAKVKSLPAAKVPTLPATTAPVFRLLGQSATTDTGTLDPLKPTTLSLLTAMASPTFETGPGLTGAWLGIIATLVRPLEQQPPFASSEAWQNHTRVTAAGAWAELRHDTLLYVKQPLVMAEGGDEKELPASKVGGYVEPRPDVYKKLGELSDRLSKASGEPNDPLKEFIAFLISTSELELANKPFPKAIDERLRVVGTELEGLCRTHGDRTPSEGLIADVLTVRDPETKADSIFHVAVGDVDELWVVVPRSGKQVLMRGGAFSFYELSQPTRLSDNDWNALRWDKDPPRPSWATPIKMPKKPKMKD
ncbi:MAG: DUF3160 domain-containing protein [Myxococcaceae bacterium]